MNYIQLFRANTQVLLFGMLLVFFSSFGQTFLVSLYIPSFLSYYDISSGFFSSMYALATLSSAATLIYAGKKIDFLPLKRFVLFVISGILVACLVVAFSWHLVVLFLGIYSLRLFGQGLLTHTGLTTMSRYFSHARGKALSIAYLGFPIGEAVFPVVIATGIGLAGWRETLVMSAFLILIVLLPASLYLLKYVRHDKIRETADKKPGSVKSAELHDEEQERWSQREVTRTRWFYIIAPTVFFVGFLQTALFFFQTFIADFKGWSTEWMAASILFYAMTSFSFSIVIGPLVDRYGARRLFPMILLPLALGVFVLSLGSHPALAPVYWMLVGFTGGMNAPITSALYAEIFGTRSLGAVRSLFTFVMVFSTALGPVVYSFFLERGYTFDQIHYGVIVVIILNAIWGMRIRQST